MQRPPHLLAALVTCFPALATPASAGEIVGGVAAHGLNLIGVHRSYESGVDIVAGIRSRPVARFAGATLRLHLLGSVNLDGGVSYAAAGAGMRWPVGKNFYIQPGVGIAVHNGNSQRFQATPNDLYLGSRVVFEPELVAGVRLSSRWAAEIAYVHLSHAQLFSRQNPGLDTLGARLTYRFGR